MHFLKISGFLSILITACFSFAAFEQCHIDPAACPHGTHMSCVYTHGWCGPYCGIPYCTDPASGDEPNSPEAKPPHQTCEDSCASLFDQWGYRACIISCGFPKE